MTESGGTVRLCVAWMLWGLSLATAVTAGGLSLATWLVRAPSGAVGISVASSTSELLIASVAAGVALAVIVSVGGRMHLGRPAIPLALALVVFAATLGVPAAPFWGDNSRSRGLADVARLPRAFDLTAIVTALWLLVVAALVLAVAAAVTADLVGRMRSRSALWIPAAAAIAVAPVTVPSAVLMVDRNGPDPGPLADTLPAQAMPMDYTGKDARVFIAPQGPGRSATPSPAGPGFLIDDESGVHVYNGADGTQRWVRDPGDFGCDQRLSTAVGGTGPTATILVHCREGSGREITLGFDAATGEYLWSAALGGSMVTVSWLSPVILVVDGDALTAYDPRTARRLWSDAQAARCADPGEGIRAAGDRVIVVHSCANRVQESIDDTVDIRSAESGAHEASLPITELRSCRGATRDLLGAEILGVGRSGVAVWAHACGIARIVDFRTMTVGPPQRAAIQSRGDGPWICSGAP